MDTTISFDKVRHVAKAARRACPIFLLFLMIANPVYGFGIIGTKWPPGVGLPSPGAASYSVMPAGLNMAGDVGGHGHNGDLGLSTNFNALITVGANQNEVNHFDTALNTWAAATQFNNLGLVVDNGALYNAAPADPRVLAGPFGDLRLAATNIIDPAGPGVEIAHAHFPMPRPAPADVSAPGDIHFNNTLTFSDGAAAGAFDFQTVALHELGHSLGLLHSGVVGSVMEPTYAGVRRTLHADDVAGINAIYGPQGLPPCVPPPSAYAASFHSYPGFNIDNPIHSGFPRCEPLPSSGQSSSHSFRSFFEGNIPGNLLDPELDPDVLIHVVGFGDTSVEVNHAGADGEVEFFETEITELSVGTEIPQQPLYEGTLLPPNIIIRQDPNRPTKGQIILNRSTGQMDSFFDVFTEISFDRGETWIPSEDSSHMEVPTFSFAPSSVKGDMNGDGVLNNFDIDPFELALVFPDVFAELFPNVDPSIVGDIDSNGSFDNFDIERFELLLTDQQPNDVPEPYGLLPILLGLLSCLFVARGTHRSR